MGKNILENCKVLTLLLSSFVFLSCGGSDSSSLSDSDSDSSELVDGVDPFLEPFIDDFVAEAAARSISVDVSEITMVFVEQDPGIAGVCFLGQGRVEIDPFFRTNTGDLRELVFHELGHCVLAMDHRPDSIMQAVDFIGITDELLDEFFSEEFFGELGFGEFAHLKNHDHGEGVDHEHSRGPDIDIKYFTQ